MNNIPRQYRNAIIDGFARKHHICRSFTQSMVEAIIIELHEMRELLNKEIRKDNNNE